MSFAQEPKPKRWWLWYAWEFSAVIAGIVGGLVIALQTYLYPEAPFNIVFVDAAIVILVMGLLMQLCVWKTWPKWNGKGLFVIIIGLAFIIVIAGVVFARSIFLFAFERPEMRATIESLVSLFGYYLLALFGGGVIAIFAAFAVAISKEMRIQGFNSLNLAVLCMPVGFITASTLLSVAYFYPSNLLVLPFIGSFLGGLWDVSRYCLYLLRGITKASACCI